MAKEIRIGVVGCGKIATVSHVPAYAELQGVKIAALCDIVPAKAETVRQKYAPEAEVYAEYSDFLKADIDAVSICTPNDLHYAMAMAALENGWHVLCEKPMAARLDEASEMIAKAREQQRILQINQSLRYAALYVKIAALVHQGRIGKPLHLRCLRTAAAPPNQNWSPGADWFVSKAHQGGLVLDIAVHMADLLKWLGGEIDAVTAFNSTVTAGIDVVDNVNAMLHFRNGAVGVLELSWTVPVGGALLEVYGTEGRIRVGFTPESIELTTTGAQELVTEFVEPDTNVKNSYASFVDAIGGIAPSPTPGQLGREALALCVAIVEASERRVTVPIQKFDAA